MQIDVKANLYTWHSVQMETQIRSRLTWNERLFP